MRNKELGRTVTAGVLGMVVAGVAALTWFFAFFLASFSFFGATTETPEPGHRVLMDFVAPALLGLATVPITRVLGAGWGLAVGISAVAFATGAASSVLVVDGPNLQGGVGTFLLVAVVTPALAVLAASVRSDLEADGVVALAGGLALTAPSSLCWCTPAPGRARRSLCSSACAPGPSSRRSPGWSG